MLALQGRVLSIFIGVPPSMNIRFFHGIYEVWNTPSPSAIIETSIFNSSEALKDNYFHIHFMYLITI